MTDEFSRAISFANGYFALVDGLAVDLEHHLAEDVVLDWFGQTIRGRKNVAAFMKYKKISSRHVFNEITPKMSIGYNETRSLRRKYHSAGGSLDNGNTNYTTGQDDEYQVDYKRMCYSETFSSIDGSFSEDSGSTDVLECEMDSDYLNTTRVCQDEYKIEITDSVIGQELKMEALNIDNFATPRLTCEHERKIFEKIPADSVVEMAIQLEPTIIEDIEMKIAELKSRDLFKIERGHGIGKSPLKFLEASGVIEFCRVFNVHQIRKDTRKRHCKLQIAYSVKDKNGNSEGAKVHGKEEKNFEFRLQEMKDPSDYEEEQNQFLQCLQLHMVKENGNMNHLSPRYIGGQLKFDKLQDVGTSGFTFNYEIHVIIYESNTKCRLNLSNEFEAKEYLED